MGFFAALLGNKNKEQLSNSIKEGAFLVDVRTPSEFAMGSVNGAINIPLDKLSAQLSAFKNKKTIVVFCRSGSHSRMAKSILEQNGLSQVINGGAMEAVRALTRV